jgi:RNA polymerase sigma-70 factor (ECF subfamily)
MEDLRLVKLIQRSGDRAAADELVRRYYEAIHGFVRKQTSDRDFALDLTQEIFISCLRTIGHFDSKKDTSFKTLLYKIAANKVVDYYRSRAYKETGKTLVLDEVEPIAEGDFVERLADGDFAARVCAFVGKLPPDTQRIFRLHIFGEQTFAEIAEALGLAEGSVKSKYYRLISLLRKEFSDET